MVNSKLKKTAISSFETSVDKYKLIAEKTQMLSSALNANGKLIGYMTDTKYNGCDDSLRNSLKAIVPIM